MDSFVTRLSQHCYYGNITNVLNYYGEKISEAELVLLSKALNCKFHNNKNLFFGMPNELCGQGLEQAGYHIRRIDSNYSNYKSLLSNNTPILLLINSGVLTHDNIFKGTDKDHYIVLLNDNDETMEISDSFVQTIPMSVFQGYTDLNPIRNEIQKNRASGVYLEKQENNIKYQDSIKNIFVDYIKMNASLSNNSVICSLKTYCSAALRDIDILFTNESIKNLSYNVKVAGAVARFNYIIELLNNHLECSFNAEILSTLKSKWELIASKLMKCSMTLKRDYYIKIFEVEIPELAGKELGFYQDLCKRGGL